MIYVVLENTQQLLERVLVLIVTPVHILKKKQVLVLHVLLARIHLQCLHQNVPIVLLENIPILLEQLMKVRVKIVLQEHTV